MRILREYKVQRSSNEYGWRAVVRLSDGEIVGRVWTELVCNGSRKIKNWVGRHYFSGGGVTIGGFRRMSDAAQYAFTGIK